MPTQSDVWSMLQLKSPAQHFVQCVYQTKQNHPSRASITVSFRLLFQAVISLFRRVWKKQPSLCHSSGEWLMLLLLLLVAVVLCSMLNEQVPLNALSFCGSNDNTNLSVCLSVCLFVCKWAFVCFALCCWFVCLCISRSFAFLSTFIPYASFIIPLPSIMLSTN